MRFARIARRGWIMILGLVGGVVAIAAVAWPSGDSWPARVVIIPPANSWPIGFAIDGRSFQTLNEAGLASWDVASGKRLPASTRPVLLSKSPARDGRSEVGVTGSDFAASEVLWVDGASGAVKARFPVEGRQILHPTLIDGDRSIRAFLIDQDSRGWDRLKEVVTWDLATGAEVKRPIQGPTGPEIRGPIAYSPDGRLCAYVDTAQDGIQLWDVETDQPRGPLLRSPKPPSDHHVSIAFAADGQTMSAGRADGRTEIWNLADWHLIRAFKVHPDGYRTFFLEFSPDGRTLALSAQLSGESSPWVWSRIRATIGSLFVGPSRANPAELAIIDLDTGQVLARSSNSVQPHFSPDGRTIITLDLTGTFSIRDVPRLGLAGQ